uniref:Expressed protein n=1 Tax=Echinococcus granulosus TaxID=6210 RepID=A0A068WQM4_ECHGR|nr:expressed protein [Echinococcus granulosus]
MCGAIACTRGGTHAPPARVHLVHAHTRAETCARTYLRVYVRARACSAINVIPLSLSPSLRASFRLWLSLSQTAGSLSRSLASRFVCESVFAFPPPNALHPTCAHDAMT